MQVTPVFAEDKVYVFWAHVAWHRHRLLALCGHLTPEESERASRFRLAADWERFVVGRGLLRETLAHHLKVAPRDLAFSYNRWGKPVMDAFSGVEFNVAHAHEVLGLAFALGRRVGIDVEWIDRAIDALGLSKRFFTAEEAAHLRALDAPHRSAAFFRHWTRKEAFVKAQGEGLGRSLEPDDTERAHWTSIEVPCADGYVANLCAEAGPWRLEVGTL
jgi:4'-phosphopantetheinyl transferase